MYLVTENERGIIVPKLYHYTKVPFNLCPRGPEDFSDSDGGAKPGGLWLSGCHRTNLDSWFRLILRSARNRPSDWCHYDIRFETEFDLTFPVPDEVLILTFEEDYQQFIQHYGEHDQNGRVSICWECVRRDYKGIAILPYRKELSRGGNDSDRYYWNTFDSSSWCLWDVKFLLDEGHLTVVEYNRQMQIQEPSAFGHKCDCCTDFFNRNPHMQ